MIRHSHKQVYSFLHSQWHKNMLWLCQGISFFQVLLSSQEVNKALYNPSIIQVHVGIQTVFVSIQRFMTDSDQVFIQLKILKLKGLSGMTAICLVLSCMKQWIPQITGQSPGAKAEIAGSMLLTCLKEIK